MSGTAPPVARRTGISCLGPQQQQQRRQQGQPQQHRASHIKRARQPGPHATPPQLHSLLVYLFVCSLLLLLLLLLLHTAQCGHASLPAAHSHCICCAPHAFVIFTPSSFPSPPPHSSLIHFNNSLCALHLVLCFLSNISFLTAHRAPTATPLRPSLPSSLLRTSIPFTSSPHSALFSFSWATFLQCFSVVYFVVQVLQILPIFGN